LDDEYEEEDALEDSVAQQDGHLPVLNAEPLLLLI